MRIWAIAAACMAVLAPAAACGAEMAPLSADVLRAGESVVGITAWDAKDNVVGRGAGFFIDGKNVATARSILVHVEGSRLVTASRVEGMTSDGRRIDLSRITADSALWDVAILRSDAPEGAVAPLGMSDAAMEADAKAYIVGKAGAGDKDIARGEIAFVREAFTYGEVVIARAAPAAWAKGAAVVNLKGQVTGMVTAKSVEALDLFFVTTAKHIRNLSGKEIHTLNEWFGRLPARASDMQASTAEICNEVWSGDYGLVKKLETEAAAAETTVEAWHKLAAAYDDFGQLQKAREAYLHALRIDTHASLTHELYCGLGNVYRQQGMTEEMVKALEEARRVDNKDASMHANLAWGYGEEGRNAEAVESYKAAIRLKHPCQAALYAGLGAVYEDMDHYEEAEDAYRKALKCAVASAGKGAASDKKPSDSARERKQARFGTASGEQPIDSATVAYKLAWLLAKSGKYDEALSSFEESINMRPESAEAFYGKGYALGKLARYSEEVTAYQNAIMLRPDYANAYYNLGLSYVMMGRDSQAESAFLECTRLNDGDAHAHYRLGEVRQRLGEAEQAVESLKKAVELNSDMQKAWLCLGIAYADMHRYEDGIVSLREAAKRRPNDPLPFYHMALCEYYLGRKDEAMGEYRVLQAIDPDMARKLLRIIRK